MIAIADELTENGLVLRYRTEETDDGLNGREGTFLICSFWLVSALAEIGELTRARELCERLLGYASPLGLYAEEIDPRTGRHLGNFPQAFTHLALINAVMHVIRADEAQSFPAGPQHQLRLALSHPARADQGEPADERDSPDRWKTISGTTAVGDSDSTKRTAAEMSSGRIICSGGTEPLMNSVMSVSTEPGAQRDRSDPVGVQLPVHRLRVGDHAGLGCRVDRQPRRRRLAGDRCQIDDLRPAVLGARDTKQFQSLPIKQDDRAQIDGELEVD